METLLFTSTGSGEFSSHFFAPETTESDKKTEFIENTEDDFHVSNPDPLKKLSQKEKEEAQVCNLACFGFLRRYKWYL